MFKNGDKVRALVSALDVKKGQILTIIEMVTYSTSSDVFIKLAEVPTYQYNALDFELVGDTGNAPVVSKTASKNDSGKIDLSLIPYVAERAEALAFMVGERKYGRYNYTKGHKASQLVAAAKRHLNAWFEGEEFDPADGQPHLGSVRACISMILRQQELGTLKDDRYKLPAGTEV